MEITDSNVVEEVSKFLKSDSWKNYISNFYSVYRVALHKSDYDENLVIDDQPKALIACSMIQCFWELLPDTPKIRYGAFFQICDFGEYYCFR